MKGVINGWMTRVRCHQVQWTFMCLVQLRLLMRFARWTGQFAALFDPSRDLPNFPELLILQNRKGQSVDALWPPAWDGSLRASPPVKGSRPIYPMETPNGVRSTVGGRFIPSGLPSSSGFYPWASLPDGRTRPTGPLSSPAWADGTSAVCLATCLLSIPACLRRGATVSQVKT